MYRHILIATDETLAGQAAVHHGVKLARVVGAKVLFVTVTRPWSALGVREVGGTGQDLFVGSVPPTETARDGGVAASVSGGLPPHLLTPEGVKSLMALSSWASVR